MNENLYDGENRNGQSCGCPPVLSFLLLWPHPTQLSFGSVGGGVELGRLSMRALIPIIPTSMGHPTLLALFTRPSLIDSLSLSFYLLNFVIKCAGEALKLLFFPF